MVIFLSLIFCVMFEWSDLGLSAQLDFVVFVSSFRLQMVVADEAVWKRCRLSWVGSWTATPMFESEKLSVCR